MQTKLTLDEILTEEGFKIITKAAQHMPPALAVTTLEAELMDYEEIVQNVSLSHTEPSIMGFSVFASAQMISSLEDEKVTFWKSHEKRFPNLRVLVEVARCLPSGNGAVERLFSMLKLLKQLHRNRLIIDISNVD